jgi:hypothetical protein
MLDLVHNLYRLHQRLPEWFNLCGFLLAWYLRQRIVLPELHSTVRHLLWLSHQLQFVF